MNSFSIATAALSRNSKLNRVDLGKMIWLTWGQEMYRCIRMVRRIVPDSGWSLIHLKALRNRIVGTGSLFGFFKRNCNRLSDQQMHTLEQKKKKRSISNRTRSVQPPQTIWTCIVFIEIARVRLSLILVNAAVNGNCFTVHAKNENVLSLLATTTSNLF